jgi:hypothetical protein
MLFLTLALVNATASRAAQVACDSFPAPVVILVKLPVTFPVRGDKFVCQMLNVSARVVTAENVTALSLADQQPGRGTLGIDACDPESGVDSKGLRRSPTCANAS